MKKIIFIIMVMVGMLNNISYADMVNPMTDDFAHGSIIILFNYFLVVAFAGIIIYWGSVILNSIKKQEDDEHIEKRKRFFKKYVKIILIVAIVLLVVYGCWFSYVQYKSTQHVKEKVIEYNEQISQYLEKEMTSQEIRDALKDIVMLSENLSRSKIGYLNIYDYKNGNVNFSNYNAIYFAINKMYLLKVTEYEDNGLIKTIRIIEKDDNNVETVEETPDILNMSFEERTKEARNFINKESIYGIDIQGQGGDFLKQYLVSNASLEKRDSYYVMRIKYDTPKIYDKEEIEKACDLAQENGTYIFDGYTFYKDNKAIYEGNEYFERIIEQLNENDIIATKELFSWGKTICIFNTTSKDANKFYARWVGINEGDIIFETEKELEIILLPSDKMTITNERDYYIDKPGKELTVEEYYQKAINNEVSEEEPIIGFRYDLSSVGNDILAGWYSTDAVNFENGYINVNYHYGGI